MANYCYVKKGGTRTTATSYTSAQAISSTTMGVANYYDSINDVHTYNTLSAGDFVLAFDSHLKDYSANTSITFIHNVNYLSVSDTDGSTYSAGAKEYTTGGLYDFTFHLGAGGSAVIKGISFSANDDLIFLASAASLTFEDCALSLTGTSTNDRFITNSADGTSITLKDVVLAVTVTNQRFSLKNSCVVHLDGVSVDVSSANPTYLFDSQGSGGGSLFAKSCDFSNLTGTLLAFISAGTGDTTDLLLTRSLIGASTTLSGPCYYNGQYVDVYSCSVDDGYHYFEHHRYTGISKEETTIHRTDGATYDGTNEFCVELQPNSNIVEFTQPLRHKLAEFELDLRKPLELVFHVAFGDDTSVITPFTNSEMWIELEQNDPNTTALGHVITTKPDDIFATPTTLEADTASWNNLSQANIDRRKIPVTTESVLGLKNGQVTAYICCAKYVSTLEIFACSLHTTN